MTISRASFNQVRETGEIPYTIKAMPKGEGGSPPCSPIW